MKIHNLKEKLFCCLVFLLCLAALMLFHIPCPVKWLTTLPCPGCGMTRAYLRLLHLDILGAFQMHPMFWSMPILVAYFFKDYRLFRKKCLNDGVLILIAVGFAAQWIVKLVMHFSA